VISTRVIGWGAAATCAIAGLAAPIMAINCTSFFNFTGSLLELPWLRRLGWRGVVGCNVLPLRYLSFEGTRWLWRHPMKYPATSISFWNVTRRNSYVAILRRGVRSARP
jgi:hypothetical protein